MGIPIGMYMYEKNGEMFFSSEFHNIIVVRFNKAICVRVKRKRVERTDKRIAKATN